MPGIELAPNAWTSSAITSSPAENAPDTTVRDNPNACSMGTSSAEALVRLSGGRALNLPAPVPHQSQEGPAQSVPNIREGPLWSVYASCCIDHASGSKRHLQTSDGNYQTLT